MSKPIFNSLGSNYSLSLSLFALRQLFFPSSKATVQLQAQLVQEFGGQVYLFYKGRDAIEFTLRAAGVGAGDSVLTQAFTCHAIEEAITRAGATPVFVDLGRKSLNPTVSTLEQAFRHAPHAKAVIIQHTLGVPAEVKEISHWCQTRQLLFIEDLAQSFGSTDADGKKLGSYGDAVICSFGRDKVIDAVSGGAAVLKTQALFTEVEHLQVNQLPSWGVRAKDMLYPILTWLIRATHQYGVGKVLFQVGRKTGLLTSPIASPTSRMTCLPAAHAAVALQQWAQLPQQLKHRRSIVQAYQHSLRDQTSLQLISDEQAQQPLLRYSIVVPDPTELARSLTRHHIYLTDRWYRQAVDSGSLQLRSQYQPGSCPSAEALAQHIFNLPTHRSITSQQAQQIAAIIQQHVS